MKAMVLAAGLGTRLRPLTDDRPKALVEINGRTLLEITLARLRRFGVREVVVNAHHFADVLVRYLAANNNFGMNIEVSREDDLLLDTGGGLKRAAKFFSRSSMEEAFILHNVDVLSTIDLAEMIAVHRKHDSLATLAVRQRKSSRYLVFNEQSELCGRRTLKLCGRRTLKGDDGAAEMVRDCENPEAVAFCGIHVVSPRLLKMMYEEGVFSIIDVYLRLASAGENIQAFRADEYYWRDVGRTEDLAQAAADMNSGVLVLPSAARVGA
jgi:mannose-1-phosphate guanylyltransferase